MDRPDNAAERITISPVEPDDVGTISQLAGDIWRRHYPGIITSAQIEYMLRQRYEPLSIAAELTRPGLWWDKLSAGLAILGFASYFLTGEHGEMKLDKLYIRHDYQRRGHGGRLIARVCEQARAACCTRLVLAVNRNNVAAIGAYRKHGFTVRATQVTDIGSGFVMDDYIMAREI
ncbi:MAG TPA: GNAT family N-acetyltransferase [Burkholderiales bacterium]|nr:GNAT family N-acetyltransferase [Burkholderiales bacterium]